MSLINDDAAFPQNILNSFLCNMENKHDLGLYLASTILSVHCEVGNIQIQLCVTYKDTIMSFPSTINDTVFQISSTAEEADQKVVRHVLHCIKVGYSVEVHSIDTDVLILLLAYVAIELESLTEPPAPFNVHFKIMTVNPTWYNVVMLIWHLGIDICKGLPYFYAFTGCDAVSAFNRKGKYIFRCLDEKQNKTRHYKYVH